MKNISYAAEINGVKEIILRGKADLSFFQKKLSEYRLVPYSENGSADITISAVSLEWKKIKFQELTVSVTALTASQEKVFFLPTAFNSNRFLAFSERFFFKTPYYSGNLSSEPENFIIKFSSFEETVLSASKKGGSPVSVENESLNVKVFLPSKNKERYFHAVLQGETETYPFEKEDILEIRPIIEYPVFTWLIESGFKASEWKLRRNAFHAKSRTYSS
ncbi:MAG TPA: hypothetical protein PL048_21375 [Leptospiraceae bacterium]|nr:hypothetical protein [Leptospiraceae bacterium]HMY69598.1 hypothetical protein [Leptospiraceae bacterium]HMZ61338.1 hypothetical protein [Leptospiraceae bacterium]HNF12629.1 hypothetical protein [Leptospiraceae bacterium]HNF24671.1 hypothetical protein [Leptospiraceae bacterium]